MALSRRFVVGIPVLLTAVVIGVAPAPLRAATPGNWALTRTTRPGPAHLVFEGSGRVLGGGAVAQGFGLTIVDGRDRPRLSSVQIRRIGRDGEKVRFDTPIARQVTQVVPGPNSTFSFSLDVQYGASARERTATLLFFPNATLETLHVSSAIPTTTRRGGGAAALSLGDSDPGLSSAGAGAGPLEAGSGAKSLISDSGIVGAIYAEGCAAVCTGSWQEGDGIGHGWTNYAAGPVGVLWTGDRMFSGPPGKWAWYWTGVMSTGGNDATLRATDAADGSALVGAYAPIGDDWALFNGFYE